jgi:hypothetical protein
LIYKDAIEASFMVNYYAYLILLNQTLESFSFNSCYAEQNVVLANRVAKSIEYCSQAGFCGAGAMGMALHIALPVASEHDKRQMLKFLRATQNLQYPIKSQLRSWD